MAFLLIPLFVHVLLQLLVVVVDLHLLGVQFGVALGELTVVLLDLQLPVDLGVAVAFDGSGGVGDLGGEDLVLLEFGLVGFRGLFGFGGELVIMDLELLIKLFNLPNQDELHPLQLLHIAVLCLLPQRVILAHHLLQLRILLVLDSINHFGEFFGLEFVALLNIVTLLVVLRLDDLDVAEEFFVEAAEARLLERD